MWGIAIDAASAALVLWLGATILLRQQRSELRRALLLAHAAVLLFVAGDVGTLLANDLRREDAALVLLYGGSMAIPPALLLVASRFAADHGFPPRWLPSWFARVAFAMAFVFWLGAATNTWHGQFVTPVLQGRNEHHWLWWTATTWCYGVLAVTFCVLASVASRRSAERSIRVQSLLLGASMSVPLAANLAYNLSDWTSPIDPSVPGFAVTVVLIGLGVHGVGLFGLSPVSTREALLATASAVLVVDRSGRPRIANEQAKALTARPHGRAAVDAVASLAASLVHAETREPASAEELWALAKAQPEKRAGALYRVRTSRDEREQWLWISAVPVRSRWRDAAAYCFRANDVTALQRLRRDNDALTRRERRSRAASRRADASGEPTGSAETWRSAILDRLERQEVFANQEMIARDVNATLDAIEMDEELVECFERATPETIWREFERRLTERMRRD